MCEDPAPLLGTMPHGAWQVEVPRYTRPESEPPYCVGPQLSMEHHGMLVRVVVLQMAVETRGRAILRVFLHGLALCAQVARRACMQHRAVVSGW